MHQLFIEYFNDIIPLTEEEKNAIVETITIKKFKKNDILLKEGEISMQAYFVLEGCVRQYHLIDGEEKTTQFYLPKEWVTSIQSMRDQSPSNHYISCSSDCQLVVGNREKESYLYKNFPKMETISRIIMERIFSQHQSQTSNLLIDTPEKRYERLLLEKPILFQLVPQYQIASFIGVKPESLSRIRKRILSNGN